MQIHLRYQSFIFFDRTFTEAHCVMIETMPSKKNVAAVKTCVKNERLKIKGKRNHSKLMLNQLKLILDVAWAISDHAALPLSRLFIACLSLLFLDLRGCIMPWPATFVNFSCHDFVLLQKVFKSFHLFLLFPNNLLSTC